MPRLKSSAATDKGLSRENNEDCFLTLPESGLWAVADGMGGHEAGEVASAIVCNTLRLEITAGRSLTDSIQAAHQAVLGAVDQGIGAQGMGSTVVALEHKGNHYTVAWVGDSRAYLWTQENDGGILQPLTTDHSYVQSLLASGAISEAEVENHPEKHVITQCIGSPSLADLRVDTVSGDWHKGQWILLCSDGLTDALNDEAIARLICESSNTEEAVTRMIQGALDHGGNDNITVQIVESPHRDGRIHYLHDWLPRATGRPWLDVLLYAVTLVALIILFIIF